MSLFSKVSDRRLKSNKFDLSHERKLSLNMGKLIPILNMEVLPGDRIRVNTECMIRLAAMLAPMMHRVNVFVHFFNVPFRLVWNEWESFITGGEDGTEAPNCPTLAMKEDHKAYFTKGSVGDYFGLPVMDTGVTYTGQGFGINALPFRAYQLIYNEYFRDQNLEEKIEFTKDSGAITDTAEIGRLVTVRQRAWQKDYLTSCLPWTQRGGEVSFPMDINYQSPASVAIDPLTGNPVSGDIQSNVTTGTIKSGSTLIQVQNIDSIEATINNLRSAVRLQEWLERTARAGSRYIEVIKSHFGVQSSDKRLQRPEWLGGGVQPVVISEVLNTSATATEEQGYMAGHGISLGRTNSFTKYFEEHGIVIGIMSVMPKTAYQQGVDRYWRKLTKYDYFWPEFAHLGEQAVINAEVYWDGQQQNTQTLGTFGYQSRYAEYKFHKDMVCGDFRDDLSYWHMGRIFDSPPELNESFVWSQPTQRIFAVTDPNVHKLYAQVYHNISALRKIPYFGTPRL